MCFGCSEMQSMKTVGSSATPRPEEAFEAHARADAEEVARLRTLSASERARMIEAACADAAQIERSRLAAGMPRTEPAPWPQSTWDFLRKCAIHARGSNIND
jgi:hypothetical protein